MLNIELARILAQHHSYHMHRTADYGDSELALATVKLLQKCQSKYDRCKRWIRFWLGFIGVSVISWAIIQLIKFWSL